MTTMQGVSRGSVRRLLVALSLPTLGLAFALSLLTTYGPVILVRITDSPAHVGALIGGEGAFALAVPVLAGMLSDRMPATRFGRRLPLVLVGAPLLTLGLLLLPFASTYDVAGMAVLAFFVGYYLYYPPYRAMYADLLPIEMLPRAQSTQAIARGAGLGGALLVGALLLAVWAPLPFIVGAFVLVAGSFGLVPALGRGRARTAGDATSPDAAAQAASVRDLLLRHRPMRTFAAANALWELSFTGLRTFIVLFVVRGLGHSATVASAVIAVVAVAYVAGAPLAARLADRYGLVPTMTWAGLIYGVGLCLGAFTTTLAPMLVLLPFVALAGAVLLTLPAALAFTVSPPGGAGTASGIIDFSRGVGVVLGPLLVGAAISGLSGIFSATHGYAAMWPVIGVPILVSLPLLQTLGAELQGSAQRPTELAGAGRV